RYIYNQMMYRLALDDSRLALPAPVYRLKAENGPTTYGMRETVAADGRWSAVQEIPFFAVPPGRRRDGLIPIYSVAAPPPAKPGMTLQVEAPAGAKPLFYALPATPADGEKPSPDIVPLYEYRDAQSGERWFATDAGGQPPTGTRSQTPLCRVWRNPASVLALDFSAQPIP
ncbi:MAG: hypothetical protein M3347_15855, partial [Armatimonadota bacterium]|nr:hypothetical protein [Armatimonadota bacterium]